MKGLFITFEGIEGSGKTTQIQLLKKFFEKMGRSVVLTREPGGTEIGDKIRKVLLNPEFKNMAPLTELFLYAAARRQHIDQVILPATQEGKIVLCDRYADATVAYQGFGRKIDRKLLDKIHILATDNLKPDLTLLLDCHAETGLKRAIARETEKNKPEDRFEKEALDFHQRVRNGYLQLAKEEPKRFCVIPANDSVENISKKIIEIMERCLNF